MMSYVEISRPLTGGSTETTQEILPLQTVVQDIVATEVSVREILSKIAPIYGKSIIREPPVDIYDEGDKLVVIVDMPGIPRECIKVRVSIDTVEISAIPQNVNGGKVIRVERLANFKVYRRIQLPCKIRISDVRAYLKDGVLYIYLPKLLDTTESLDVTIE